MDYLVNTNVAARWVLAADPHYSAIRSAVAEPHTRGDRAYICPQNLLEFHALATRLLQLMVWECLPLMPAPKPGR